MNAIIAKLRIYFLLLIFPVLISLILLTCGCGKKHPNLSAEKFNKPLEYYRSNLLDTAFEAASSIPVNPHIKDRSRAQEAVVETCLQLGQPGKAGAFSEQIKDWRRGTAYAGLALYYAQNYSDSHIVRNYLNLAGKISADANLEDWRRDRIKVKIAQTYTVLGQTNKANPFDANVEDSENGKVAITKAIISDENSFDEQVKSLDKLIASGKFDILKNAMDAYTQLFNRFYTDEKKCSLAEEKIKTSLSKLPIPIRMELLMKMAGFVLEHADKGKAIELVNQAQLLLDNYQCRAEDLIPMMAKLSELRYRAGDIEKARKDTDAALALFNTEKQKIANIYRAGVLRPLAQAYKTMGDKTDALEVYKRAIEEGIENPNSWPRAEDLSATCCSMALYAVEPDTQLWSRIKQIVKGLGEPW